LVVAAAAALLLAGAPAFAGELPGGEEIAHQINSHNLARTASRTISLELIDTKGDARQRRLRNHWKFDTDTFKQIFFVLSPPDMKHMGYLVLDHLGTSRDDDQFIYKPRQRTARRIPQTARGDAFLGSDFSVEDVKRVKRLEVDEYHWKTLGEGEVGGHPVYLVEQRPATPELAKHLGYERMLNHVDRERWIRRKIEFWDTKSKPLKTFEIDHIERADGIWTPGRIVATNQQTGHRSILRFESTVYNEELPDELFTTRALEREVIR
jgi:outer membrane lipoprotein-sorting protein